MSRVARVTEYIGRGDGGFYVEEPDIPEGLTCNEWRRRRAETRTQRPSLAFSWPGLHPPAIRRPQIQLGTAFPAASFGEAT